MMETISGGDGLTTSYVNIPHAGDRYCGILSHLEALPTDWVEFSPYEIGMAKYGTFMTPDLFGSKFFMGSVVKKYKENPLHFLMGKTHTHTHTRTHAHTHTHGRTHTHVWSLEVVAMHQCDGVGWMSRGCRCVGQCLLHPVQPRAGREGHLGGQHHGGGAG